MRLVTLLTICGVASFGLASRALAQGTPAEQAEALNEEGKNLYKDKSYQAAAEKFRAAIQISPDARFYFNLCASLEKTGDLDAALKACDDVYAHNPSEALKGKTGERAAEIRKKRGEAPPPGGGGTGPGPGGGPTGPGPGGGPTTGGGPTPPGGGTTGGGLPPPADVDVSESLRPGDYRFSVGAEVGVAHNRSIGDGFLEKNGGVLKLHADFLILPAARVGIRGSLDFFSYNGGAESDTAYSLGVTDFGGSLYWHARLTDSLWFTPLAGVQVAVLSPSGVANTPYATFGVRLEAALQYLFGENHHVISFGPLLSAYLPASNDAAPEAPSYYGLDTGGVAFAFTLGYTYRFTEALPAFVTLE